MKALDLSPFSKQELLIMLKIAKRYNWKKQKYDIITELSEREYGRVAQ